MKRVPSLLDRRRQFESLHPDVTITAPFEAMSGLWEVQVPGEETVLYEHAASMLAALEERYAE